MASGPADRLQVIASRGVERLIEPLERALGLNDDATPARMLSAGAMVCVAYALLHIAYHGISFDEVIPPAQIITGAVQYPPGHPHELYYKHAYALLHYLAAGLLSVIPKPIAVAAPFNVLWLVCTTFVPFALVTVLTRRAVWGYAAATLVVLNSARPFDGTYPLFTFPAFMSNGHVGAHAIIIVIVFMFARMWRSAGLLLGVLPALHAAMAAAVWPWAGLYLLVNGRSEPRARRDVLTWGAMGLVVCVALVVLVRMQSVAAPLPPYDVTGDASALYRSFTATTDEHRRPFPLATLGYLVNPVAFFGLGALLLAWTRDRSQTVARDLRKFTAWLLVFGAMVWVVVYGARLYRGLIGPLPLPLEMVMPFRYSNLTALLLIPVTIAAIAMFVEEYSPRDRLVALGLITLTLLAAGVGLRFDRDAVVQYVLVSLWGMLLALAVRAAGTAAARNTTLATLAAIGGALLLTPSRSHFFWFVGAFAFHSVAVRLGSLGSSMPPRPWSSWASRVALGGFAAVSLVALKIHGSATTWHTVSDFDRRVISWLNENAKPGEPILPSTYPYTALQAKTGHPVLLQWETLYIVAYTPSLAPAVNVLAKDFLGVDYSLPGADGDRCGSRIPAWCPAFAELWKGRTVEDWQRLGAKYGFRLVLGRTTVPLDLTPVVEGPTWILYTIPSGE